MLRRFVFLAFILFAGTPFASAQDLDSWMKRAMPT